MNPESSGKPVCRVCGVEIVDEPRVCARCETPHHRDCWGYVGRCSTYGCMSAAEGEAAGGAVVVAGEEAALAMSAKRAAAIVPVGIAATPEVARWIADDVSAWHRARDARVRVAAGERVVMLPQHAVLLLSEANQLPEASGPPPLLIAGAVVIMAVSGLVVGAAGFVGALFAFVALGSVTARSRDAGPFSAWLRAERTCLVRNAKRLWVRGENGDRPWERLLEEPDAPRSVRLARSAATVAGSGQVTYRLGLRWASPKEPDRVITLAPAVHVPEEPRARLAALEQLAAQRALGQHIAALLALPFEETEP